MASTIRSEAKRIRLNNDEDMNKKINDLMGLNDKVNDQHFIGDEVCTEMISNMEDRMIFSMNFLMSKNEEKKVGEIGIVFVHFPFDYDDRTKVSPQIVHGFRVPVKLPFRGEKAGIKNPLCSPAAADYLRQQWLKKMGLHTRTVVTVIEKAKDMSLPANNQSSEGLTRKEKHLTRDIRVHTAEPGTYMWYRYLELHRGSRYLMDEMDRCESYIGRRRARFMSKQGSKKNKGGEQKESMTEDSRKIQEENNSHQKFSKKGTEPWKDEEEELRKSLEMAYLFQGFEHKSLLKKYDDVKNFATLNGGELVSRPTFNKWFQRQKCKRLNVGTFATIKLYVESVNADDDETSTELAGNENEKDGSDEEDDEDNAEKDEKMEED